MATTGSPPAAASLFVPRRRRTTPTRLLTPDVRLENDGGALPLRADGGDGGAPRVSGGGLSLAAIGRNANATTNMQGNYYGTAPYLVSPLDGLARYAAGGVAHSDGSDVRDAAALAAAADATVLVVGLTSEADADPDEACAERRFF